MAERRGKEEYQLPEEENLESHYEEDEVQFSEKPQKAPFSAKEMLLSKKVLVPALIILGVYGLYKFMEFRDKQQLKVQQPTNTTVEAAKQPPAAAVPNQPVNDNLVVKNDLQAAIEQTNKNQAQLESVGTQLNQLQLTQTQMNSELNELSDAVKALAAKLEQPRPTMITPRPRLVKRVRRYHRRAVPSVSYHLRAVVPGRAWIESSSGRLFTVRTGDRIVGFGIIEEIDVTRGLVITSSGREITYGKYDS